MTVTYVHGCSSHTWIICEIITYYLMVLSLNLYFFVKSIYVCISALVENGLQSRIRTLKVPAVWILIRQGKCVHRYLLRYYQHKDLRIQNFKMKLSVKLRNFSKQHGRAMILNLRFAASRFQMQGSSWTIA